MDHTQAHAIELADLREDYERQIAALRGQHAAELHALTERLTSAEETLRAIRSGEIDALVVETATGDCIFTLAGVDHPYRVMVESMQEGAATVSDHALTLYANRRLGELLGTPLPRLIGAPFTMFAASEDRFKLEQLLRDASHDPVHAEMTLQTDAGPIVTSIAASPLNLDGTKAICLVITDLTQQKRTEQSMQTANVMLEQRTLELTRSNQELEQFAYIASHDLQAPLRTISGFVELLADALSEEADSTVTEYLGYIVSAANRMHALILDLLQFSRLGTAAGRFVPTDAEAALNHVLTALGVEVAETGAVITHDPLPTITADPGQLEQLLQNLIDNAIKFHGEQPPRVHVTAQRLPGAWQFSVADNGIGLDPRFANKIFAVFQRLHPHGDYPGTGIGLAVCKKIVERHGGRISVDSAPGHGARFTFTIPDA